MTAPDLTLTQIGSIISLYPLAAVPATLIGAWLESRMGTNGRLAYVLEVDV